jgi:hypothetical protein
MDRITKFKNAVLKAKQKWLRDKRESEEMYGEGVLTRKQAKLELLKPKPDEPETEDHSQSVNDLPETNEEIDLPDNSVHVESDLDNLSVTISEKNESDEESNKTINVAHKPNIFKEETLVAENDTLKVYAVQTFFKRQKKFHLQDHQYEMHFKKRNDQPILLSSVLDILEKAFFAVLQNLKSFYKSDEENFVYMTLTQDNLFNPFRTSPYVLQSNDTNEMVDHLMVNFNRFVNSNSTLPLLEKSFCVFFRVLSDAHVNDSNHRRKAIPIRHTVGMSRPSKIFLAGGLISLPQSYSGHNNPLPQNCLPTSIAFGYLKLHNSEMYQNVKKMLHLNSKKADKIQASIYLYELTQDLCQKSQIELHGPHEITETCPNIASVLKIQIHVILSMDGPSPSVLSFPPGNNKNLPRLYLLAKNGHVNLIDNLRTFFTHHKRSICFDCKIFFSNHWRRTHRCRRSLSCFNCRGILMTEETITDQNEDTVFCDSKIVKFQTIDKDCKKCNLNFKTTVCYQNHEKLCASNSLGWKCTNCGIFETGLNQTTIEELQSKHKCGIKSYKCMFCYKIKEENHVCQINKQFSHTIWPNLCFLHMAFKDDGCGNCNNCFQIRKTYAEQNNITLPELFKSKVYSDLMCPTHKNNNKNPRPNVISVFKEEHRHKFQEYLFCDDDLKDSLSQNLNTLNYPYSEKKPDLSKLPFKMKKTRQTVSIDFQQKIQETYNQAQEKNAIDKLMLFFCESDSFSNYAVIVSEARGLLTLLEAFLKLNLVPNIIQDGNQINLIEIPSLKLKFLYNGNYLKGSISHLAEQYGVPYEVNFFPKSWNNSCYYNYVGKIPPRDDFYLFSDSKEEKLKKDEFYSQISEPWSMQDALILNERLECQTFTLCCLSFVTQCFELQNLLQKKAPQKTGEIHPYGWKISSLSGFTFAVFSYFYMNDYDMYSVMNPFAGNVTQTSQGEYEWTSWLNWKSYGLNLETAFNSFDGQKRFGKHAVDGYCSRTKTVYQYKGCEVIRLKKAVIIILTLIIFINYYKCFFQFHFHLPPDCLNPRNADRTIDSVNNYGVPLKDLLQNDQLEQEVLLNYFSFDVKKIEEIYECQWKKYKAENSAEMEVFWSFSGLPKNRPLNRLIPRATLRGGFIEVYRLKFTIEENPGWTLHFVDANSLYSHIVLNNTFPVGKYEVLLHKDDLSKNIKLIDGKFFYKDESMSGDAAHVKIVAPSYLFRPYLPYRLNDEFSHLALCKECLRKKLSKRCIHRSQEKRSFTSCYQITDLEKAVALGYEILEWYEVHHYKKRENIFAEFVKTLAAQKLRNTNIFQTNSEEDKTKICDYINSKMNFDPTSQLRLEPNCITENPAQKELFKVMLNSFYGRFALHTNFTHHYFCRSLHEIERYASQKDTKIIDIISFSEDICEIEVVSPTKIKPNLNGTLYITSEINALARKFIYEKSEDIEKTGGVILSIDTDAIIFALPPGVKSPLVYSHAFGDFKDVLGSNATIESFYSLGPRNYSITYKDFSGAQKHLLKVKGLSTQSSNNCDIISSQMYQDFIEKQFNSDICHIYLPQMRKKVEKQTKKFHEILTYFEF